MSPRLIERLALTIAARITARHQSGAEPVSSEALAQEIGTIEERVLAVLDRLDAEGILVRSAEEPPRYLLSRSPRHIRIAELIDALHREVEDPGTLARLDRDPAVARIGEALEAARGNALDGLSLADLAPAQLASDQAEASDSRTGR
jgi:DNA-binding IscR family transcriptional regulator